MAQALTLEITNFSGPFDLLLELVKSRQMDLAHLNLVEIASAYIDFIRSVERIQFDIASEYLIIAATLVHLKARSLLEEESSNSEAAVNDEEAELLERLVEYSKFRERVKTLREREELRKNILIKKPFESPEINKISAEETTILRGTMAPTALITILRRMFERINAMQLRETMISHANISTPIDRRLELLNMLKKKNQLSSDDFFLVNSLENFAVTVLALLDMARKNEVIMEQTAQFAKIYLTKGGNNGE